MCLDHDFTWGKKRDENDSLKRKELHSSIVQAGGKKKLELVTYNFYKILKAYLKNLLPEFSGYKNRGLSFSDP